MENLSIHANPFTKCRSTNRHNHKLLNINGIVCVGATIQNVAHRHRKSISAKSANITVERKTKCICSSARGCKRDAKHRICTNICLILCPVNGHHRLINQALIKCGHSDKFATQLHNILKRAHHTLSIVSLAVTISQFVSFMSSRTCTRWHHCNTNNTASKLNFHFQSGISTRIKQLSSANINNFVHDRLLFSVNYRPRHYILLRSHNQSYRKIYRYLHINAGRDARVGRLASLQYM